MPGTTCARALQIWVEKNDGADFGEAEVVKLLCMMPPIEKMDATLGQLVNVRHLALSSNAIEKMLGLPNCRNLEILSLGRNAIKKISGLEDIGETLKELWLSYNQISSLDGLNHCRVLHTLFMSNNRITNWNEVPKLQMNPHINSVLFLQNPIYEGLSLKQARNRIVELVPGIGTVDGSAIVEGDDEEDHGEADAG